MKNLSKQEMIILLAITKNVYDSLNFDQTLNLFVDGGNITISMDENIFNKLNLINEKLINNLTK
jgi:hypothetical protein